MASREVRRSQGQGKGPEGRRGDRRDRVAEESQGQRRGRSTHLGDSDSGVNDALARLDDRPVCERDEVREYNVQQVGECDEIPGDGVPATVKARPKAILRKTGNTRKVCPPVACKTE